MSEEQEEQAFELQEAIWTAVHILVDQMTEGVDPDVDYVVRQRLTETFRFWRRKCSD